MARVPHKRGNHNSSSTHDANHDGHVHSHLGPDRGYPWPCAPQCRAPLVTMPPKGQKRTMTPTEQVQRLQQRSREIAFRAKFAKIQRVLRCNMYLTDTVTDHLETVLGRALEDIIENGAGTFNTDAITPRKVKEPADDDEGDNGTPTTCRTASGQQSEVASSSGGGQQAASDGEAGGDGEDGEDAMQSWGYCRLSTYSITLLMNLLSAMEPASLSKHALRAVVIRGKRKDSTEALLKILEYCTGLGPSWSATGPYKRWKTLYAYVKALNKARGRRARELVLPVHWSAANGVYGLRVAGKRLYLKQNFTMEEAKVSAATIKLLGGTVGDINIDQNWGESTAQLVSPKTPETYLCILIISNHITEKAGLDDFYKTLEQPPLDEVKAEETLEQPEPVKEEEEEEELRTEAEPLAKRVKKDEPDDTDLASALGHLMSEDEDAALEKEPPVKEEPAEQSESATDGVAKEEVAICDEYGASAPPPPE